MQLISGRQPRGFILFAVLAVVLVLSVLSAAALHSFGSGHYAAANTSDRETASRTAQAVLDAVELRLLNGGWTAADFRVRADLQCRQGLCAEGENAAVRRCGKNLCLHEHGIKFANRTLKNLFQSGGGGHYREPRYVIELLGSGGGSDYFRITAWARGQNLYTQVLAQRYVRIVRPPENTTAP